MATLKTHLTASHLRIIKAHLEAGQTITPKSCEALCGCMQPARRIYDLRKAGMRIKMVKVPFVNQNGHKGSYGAYTLDL
jgi:hypothetical protein